MPIVNGALRTLFKKRVGAENGRVISTVKNLQIRIVLCNLQSATQPVWDLGWGLAFPWCNTPPFPVPHLQSFGYISNFACTTSQSYPLNIFLHQNLRN